MAAKPRSPGGSKKTTRAPSSPRTPPVGSPQERRALEAWFAHPDDPGALRVLADHWAEQGDPRGEVVQLSLEAPRSAEQAARLAALFKKHGGALVGPARPHLREWSFGPWGVVETARCEADRLAEGIDAIGQVHPRLSLCVTSVKTRATMQALARVDLRRVHFIGFTMGIIGSLGGTNLTDTALATLAPAFKGVRRLALEARGGRALCFTPEGLAALADQHEGFDFFALDYYSVEGADALPSLRDYVDVLAGHRAFRQLQAVVIPGADQRALSALPRLRHVRVDDHAFDELPCTAAQWAALAG